MQKETLKAMLDKMLEWFEMNQDEYLITTFLLRNKVTEKEFKEACLSGTDEIQHLYYLARTYEKNRVTVGMLEKKFNGFSCESFLKNEHDWKEKEIDTDKEANDINEMLRGISGKKE